MLSKKAYNFTDKTQSKDAIIAFGMGLFSLAIIVASIIRGVSEKGNIGPIYGLCIIISLIIGISSLFFVIPTYKDEDTLSQVKNMALFVDIIVIFADCFMFVIGLA